MLVSLGEGEKGKEEDGIPIGIGRRALRRGGRDPALSTEGRGKKGLLLNN